MKLGWLIKDALEAKHDALNASRVHCGTCPVSIQCISADGGNGWKFSCCGSAAIDVFSDEGVGVLLILDCEDNRFKPRELAEEMHTCPLCSGDIVKGHLLGMSDHHRYVPTVHAKHGTSIRLAQWRKVLPEARALKKRIDERAKKT